jgi:hypothetical protein
MAAEMPDHVSAAAFSLSASAGGVVKAVKTTPLMTIEESTEAMKKTPGVGSHHQDDNGPIAVRIPP